MNNDEINLKVNLLKEHYSETVNLMGQYAKSRDRALILFTIVLIFMYVQLEVPQLISVLFDSLLKKYIQNSITLPPIILTEKFVNNIIWFFSLGISLKYFNARLHLRRLRKYSVKIENELCTKLNEKDIINREKDSFKSSAIRTFHFFILFLHRVVFTLIVLGITTIKISKELVTFHLDWQVVVDLCVYLVILLALLLYIVTIITDYFKQRFPQESNGKNNSEKNKN